MMLNKLEFAQEMAIAATRSGLSCSPNVMEYVEKTVDYLWGKYGEDYDLLAALSDRIKKEFQDRAKEEYK